MAFALGSGGECSQECDEFSFVLGSRAGFYSAYHINAEGPNHFYGVADVVCIEAAGQDERNLN